MTPALSILCAVLVAVIAWHRSSLLSLRDRLRHSESQLESLREGSAKQIATDAAIHASAFRLLRDPRARGKNVRHSAWLTEVDELCRKWRGEL